MSPLPIDEPFAEVLGRLLTETHTSVRRAAALSGVSRRTLENWVHGRVRQPRDWEPILQVARALHLSAADVDALLLSAAQPSLARLQAEPHSEEQTALLAFWPLAPPGEAASEASRSRQIPLATTSFVGRHDLLDELSGLVARPDVRLITVTGPGGIGKTRLVQEMVLQDADVLADDVYFVTLDGAQTLEDLLDRLLAALPVQRDPAMSRRHSVLEFLSGKQALLVLDTFENVLAAAPFVAEMVRHAPQLQVLVTSRAALRLSGEHVFTVPFLPSVPEIDSPEEALSYEAVALLVERIRTIEPTFAISKSNVLDVVAICRLVDGLPLALELVAGRARALALPDIRRQLEHSPHLLADGPQDVPRRQRSIEETIAWSYDLLSEDEQALFQRLSVCSEGCTLSTARVIASRDLLESESFIKVLTTLVDHSLVQFRLSHKERIYYMHDLTRQFAQGRLARAGLTEPTMRRLFDHISDLAERLNTHFRDGDREYWLNQFDPEANQVWQLLEWGLDTRDPDTVSRCLALCGTMLQYWNLRGMVDRGRRWTELALAAAEALELPPSSRATAYCTASALALIQSEPEVCAERAEAGLEAARLTGDRRTEAHALHLRGLAQYGQGDLEATEATWTAGLAVAEALGNGSVLARALDDLGNLAARRGEFEKALALHAREQQVSQEAGDLYSEFYAVLNLGDVSIRLNRPLDAAHYNQRALSLSRAMGDTRGLSHTLITQARLLRQLKRPAEAHPLLLEALELSWRIRNLDIVVTSLEQLALVGLSMPPDVRVQLLALVAQRRGQYGLSSYPEDQKATEILLAILRQEMGVTTYAAAWASAQSLDLDTAVKLGKESEKVSTVRQDPGSSTAQPGAFAPPPPS